MKVLVAVDNSEASRIAVAEVASRPWPKSTAFEVLSVADTAPVAIAPDLEAGILKSADEAVRCAAQRLSAVGIESASFVLTGDAKTVVVDYANRAKVDLIVVGSHRESAVMQFFLGSVARAVVRHAHCSVEIVRSRTGQGAMKVLISTDGSECSEAAVSSVAARPWPEGSEFRVISVAELGTGWMGHPYPPYLSESAMQQVRAQSMKQAEEAVMAAELILSNANLPESGTVMVPASTLKELILTEARDWGADLIVVGSHGRRGASRFLLGSVSEAVAFHAGSSVEIIRAA